MKKCNKKNQRKLKQTKQNKKLNEIIDWIKKMKLNL